MKMIDFPRLLQWTRANHSTLSTTGISISDAAAKASTDLGFYVAKSGLKTACRAAGLPTDLGGHVAGARLAAATLSRGAGRPFPTSPTYATIIKQIDFLVEQTGAEYTPDFAALRTRLLSPAR